MLLYFVFITLISSSICNLVLIKEEALVRVKRQNLLPPPPKDCNFFINQTSNQLTDDQLRNLNLTIFSNCPGKIYERVFSFEQISLLTQSTIRNYGSPCGWNPRVLTDHPAVIFGLNISQLNCLNFSSTNLFKFIGESVNKISSIPPEKIQTLLNIYKQKNNPPIPGQIDQLQGLACGLDVANLANMTYLDTIQAAKTVANFSCFNKAFISQFYTNLAPSFSLPENMTCRNVSDMGSIIGGMPVAAISKLKISCIPNIHPKAFRMLTAEQLLGMLPEQFNALELPQVISIPPEVVMQLTADRRARIGQLINGTLPTTPDMPGFGNMSIIYNVTSKSIGGTIGAANIGINSTQNVRANEMTTLKTNLNMNNETNNDSTFAETTSSATTIGVSSTSKPASSIGLTNASVVNNAIVVNNASVVNNNGLSSVAIAVDSVIPSVMNIDNNPYNNISTTTTLFPPIDALATLPAVIDSSNINKLIGSLSATDVQKIDPAALASPEVLLKLRDSEMDPSMEQAMKDKISDMITNKPFDAGLYAAGGGLVPPKAIQGLTPEQALSVTKDPLFVPDENTIGAYGKKVANALDTVSKENLGAKFQEAAKVIQGVPVKQFAALIDKATVDLAFLSNFNSTELTDKQSRDLYAKFRMDTVTNVANQSSADLLKFASSLPSCLRSSIKSEDIANVAPGDAFKALQTISSPSQSSSNIDPKEEVSELPSPTLLTLLDKITKWDNDDNVKFALDSNMLTVKLVKTIGTRICPIITDKSREHSFFDISVLNAAYDICKTTLGPIGKSTSKEYGVLSRVASAADLGAMTPEFALQNNIPKMCVGKPNSAQLQATTNLLAAYFNKSMNFQLNYRNMDCMLPTTKLDQLYQVTLQPAKDDMCQQMSCQKCSHQPWSAIAGSFKYCQTSTSVRNMICKGQGGSCFLSSLTINNFNTSFKCDVVIKNVDVLQSSVLDCNSRAYIYSCLQPYNLSNANNVARLGTLLDQLSEAEWGLVKKSSLCGLLTIFKKIYAQWDDIKSSRNDAGLKEINFCNKMNVINKLLAADSSSTCSVGGARKKRATSGITCSQIQQMGTSIKDVDVAQLSNMANDDFTNCVNLLGTIDFSSQQLQALAIVAKKVYGSSLADWSTETLVSMGGLICGLSATDIALLKFKSIEAVSPVGVYGRCDADQFAAVFKSLKVNMLNNPADLSGMTSAQLKSLGEVICGATAVDMNTLSATAFCDAIQNVGRVTRCADNQLVALGSVYKATACIGSTPANWKNSDIAALGNLIGGLSKTDLSQLSASQINAIKYQSIPYITAINFNGFTETQLYSFSTQQAAVITADQYNSLDSAKQKAIKSLLAGYASDISMDFMSTGKNDARVISLDFFISMILIVVPILV